MVCVRKVALWSQKKVSAELLSLIQHEEVGAELYARLQRSYPPLLHFDLISFLAKGGTPSMLYCSGTLGCPSDKSTSCTTSLNIIYIYMYYISDLQSDLVSLIPIVAILRQECRLVYSIYFFNLPEKRNKPTWLSGFSTQCNRGSPHWLIIAKTGFGRFCPMWLYPVPYPLAESPIRVTSKQGWS